MASKRKASEVEDGFTTAAAALCAFGDPETKISAGEAEKTDKQEKSKKAPKKPKFEYDPKGDPEEYRKNMQREIQSLVRQMRSENIPEHEIKIKVNQLKKKRQKIILKEINKADRLEKGAKHHVVIIPVFWRREEKNKFNVETVCSEIQTRLIRHGINVWIDSRREYTPGQKYAYWEHLGVALRIEVGASELNASTGPCCNIVCATKPGAYTEHLRSKSSLNSKAIISQLTKYGLKDRCPDLAEENYWSDDDYVSNSVEVGEDVQDNADTAGNVHISKELKLLSKLKKPSYRRRNRK